MFSKRDGKKIRKTFPTSDAARAWRNDSITAVRTGEMRSATTTTINQAAEALIAGMKDGTTLTRMRGRYKPATIRGYEEALTLRLRPALGTKRLADVDAIDDVQKLANGMMAEGLSASTIHNTLDPLRVIYRVAIRKKEVSVDPTKGLELEKPKGRRERIADTAEAKALIAALPVGERALWACAFYAGLRRGELRALQWGDIDLPGRVIHVQRGWDAKEGEQEGKSAAAKREVPVLDPLARELAAHKLLTKRDGVDLVFGRSASEPFVPSTARSRALKAWGDGGHNPITLHECRHTCASLLIAAGVNAKALSEIMGHASISITFDIYGHKMSGAIAEAAAAGNAYLSRAEGKPPALRVVA